MSNSEDQATRPWIQAFAYAEFDADCGQVMRSVYPAHGQRDPSRRRGFAQSALVAVSQFPYVGLLRAIAGIVGPLYYKIGPTALEAAYNDTSRWPSPVPGSSLDLPLLGQVLRFHVPWTGMECSREQQEQAVRDTADPTCTVPRALPAARPNRALSLAEVFAAKHSEVPGVFQEIGLFAAFRSLTPCLWSIWELVITGQPLLLLGASPDVCGDAVMGAVSLIAPMRFSGDFRPYCTLYDPDFKGLAAAVNAAGEADVAAGSAGVSNWALTFVGGGSAKAAAINSPRLPGPAARPRPGEGGGSSAQPPAAHAAGARTALAHDSQQRPSPGPAGQTLATSAQQLPAIPPFGTPISSGAAYAVPFQTTPAADRRRRRRQPAHMNSGLATRDSTRSDVGLLPEACPVLIGSTNPYFTRALGNCPNAVWLGSHPPLLPTPNPTSLPSVPSGGGAHGPRRRASFRQHALHSVSEQPPTPAQVDSLTDKVAHSLTHDTLDGHETLSVGSADSSPSMAAESESAGGQSGTDDGEEGGVETATAAELAAATAAVLRRVERTEDSAGFTSEQSRVVRAASAGSSSSVWGHRELMTPSSRRNKRASSSSNTTTHSNDGAEVSASLAELSSSMLLDTVRSVSGDTSPAMDSPAAGAKINTALRQGADVSDGSLSSPSAPSAAAGGHSGGSVHSKTSVGTHVGHVARHFSPQVLRAAAAAYHASFISAHSVRVLHMSSSLAECLPGPGETSTADPVFVMRRSAWVKPDENVLRQLLPLRRTDEATLQERLAAGHGIHVSRSAAPTSSEGLAAKGSSGGLGAGNDVAFHSMLEGHVPAVLINNALLRQHFRSLTRDFLQPFEGYFSVARAAAAAAASSSPVATPQPSPLASPLAAQRGTGSTDPPLQAAHADRDVRQQSLRTLPSSTGGVRLQHTYGPYDDLADALLPAFDKAEFFAQLKRRGPPKLLANSKWLALYRAFVAGPLFPTWFQARRDEAKQHLKYLARALRISATDASLHACMLPRGAAPITSATADSDQLYAGLSPPAANSAAAKACNMWYRVRLALRDAYGAERSDSVYHTAMRRHAGVVWRWLRSDARELVAETERAMLAYGDADSQWILQDLVRRQTSHQSPAVPPVLQPPPSDGLPELDASVVDFDGTQHAIEQTAASAIASPSVVGQQREGAAVGDLAEQTVGAAYEPGLAAPQPSSLSAAVGDERSMDVRAQDEPVHEDVHVGHVDARLPEPLVQVEQDDSHSRGEATPTPPDGGTPAVESSVEQDTHVSLNANNGPAAASSPSRSASASASHSPSPSPLQATPVQPARVHSTTQSTPLPISPDVSTAHPHVPQSHHNSGTNSTSNSPLLSSHTGALLQLPPAAGSAHSVILGAGGLIGHSRSLGKGHVHIQRR